MNKTPKKILGLLGLAFVVAMTIFAAALPSPEASAISTSTMTDSIVVTVTPPPYVASVDFLDHRDDVPYVDPRQNINFNYNGVEQVMIELTHTDVNGATNSHTVYNATVAPSGQTETLALNLGLFGYGRYELVLSGNGRYGAAQSRIRFSYVPVTAKVAEDPQTGEIVATLDYDNNSTDIDHFRVEIYDENGNLAATVDPVNKPTKRVVLPFDNLPKGKYTVSVLAIDPTGGALYQSWDDVFTYSPMVMAVPNTGGLFMGLNISKADYLVTGLIIFAMIGGFGVWFISKHRKSSKKR